MNKKLLYSCAFIMMASTFTLQAQTQIGSDIYGALQNDQYGNAIALSADGHVMAIGSPTNNTYGAGAGLVKVFQNIGGTWTQLGATIKGEGTPYLTNYQMGKSVALSADGSILAIGAPYYSGPNWEKQFAGGVRIMKNVSGTWTEIGYILGENESDNSGDAISLSADGNTVAIGNQFSKAGGIGDQTGQVRVFKNIAGVWTQMGTDINGLASHNNFGRSVALSADGTTVAAGAPFNSESGIQTGQVRAFRFINGVWTKIGDNIDGDGSADSLDYMFGISVGLSSDGNILAIGGWRYPSNSSAENWNAGHVKVYRNINGVWDPIGAEIVGEVFGDGSGILSLSTDGNVVAIGSSGNDNAGDTSGQVRVFQNVAGNWTQIGTDINGKQVAEMFGSWVTLSGDGKTVAGGAPFNDPNGITNAGAVRAYDLSTSLKSNTYVLDNFSVFPNPVKNELTITLQQDLSLEKVIFYNTLGQIISTEIKNTINVSSFEKGVYFVEIMTNKGNATKKIVIE